MNVRIITPEEYQALLNTATVYRDPVKRAKLATKPIEVLQKYLATLDAYEKQGDEVFVFDLTPEAKAEIIERLRPEDRTNPEAVQRFAGSWYFAAMRDLKVAIYSEVCAKQPVLF